MKNHSPFARSRRDGRRVPFYERVTIQTSRCKCFKAHDLSLSGIGFEGNCEMSPGSDLLVKFEFVSDAETYFAHARLQWKNEKGFGVSFQELGSSAERGISHYIDHQEPKSSE